MKTLKQVTQQYTGAVGVRRNGSAVMTETENVLAYVDSLISTTNDATTLTILRQIQAGVTKIDDERQQAIAGMRDAQAIGKDALLKVSDLEAEIITLMRKLESAKLDTDSVRFELGLVRDGLRQKIQASFEDGEAMAITGLCLRLSVIMNLNAEALEESLVQAIDGSTDSLYQFLNSLLDGIEQSAA